MARPPGLNTAFIRRVYGFGVMRESARNLLVLLVCLSGITLAAQTPADIQLNQSNRVHFVAYGDTRFTDPANTKAANPEVRRELVKAIANAHPDFVTFGGDITYNGNN